MPLASRTVRLAVGALVTGVGAGVGGGLVALLLRLTGRIALALAGGPQGPAWRHVLPLVVAGVLGGVGWWAVRRFGRPVVRLGEAVAGARQPVVPTVVDVALQAATVGLGASAGREGAPREFGGLVADRVAGVLRLDAPQRALLIACGAGAGLAAVYDVPVSGVLFALEVLLGTVGPGSALAAVACSGIATLIARVVVEPAPYYHVVPPPLTGSAIGFAVVAGPLVGFAATGFVRLLDALVARRPRGAALLGVLPLAFVLVGLVGIPLPQVLGNGSVLAQAAFSGAGPLLLLVCALAKTATTGLTLGSGAAGGRLTPSLSVGAALGGAAGVAWALVWPGLTPTAAALIVGAAFLAVTLRAPLTALALVAEFTGVLNGSVLPEVLAVGGAFAIAVLLPRVRARRSTDR